jgi:hypothetical protein
MFEGLDARIFVLERPPDAGRLPRGRYRVADVRLLREQAVMTQLIERFDSHAEQVMLPWSMAYELTKGSGETFAASVEHLLDRPQAVAVAYGAMELTQRNEIRLGLLAPRVEYRESTKNLREILLALRGGLITRDQLPEVLRDTAARAAERIESWRFPTLFKSGVVGVKKSLTRDELKAIRDALASGDRAPLRAVLLESFTQEKLPDFLRGVHVPEHRVRTLARMPSFASLQFIASIAISLHWAVMNGIDNTKELVNDGVDQENVLIALYGRGFITRDVRAADLYRDLVAVAAEIWPRRASD